MAFSRPPPTAERTRSNVGAGLKELQNWGVIRTAHVLGNRSEHYESLKDIWEMLRIVAEERKRRELDPTLAILRECTVEAEKLGEDPHTKKVIGDFLEFFLVGIHGRAGVSRHH